MRNIQVYTTIAVALIYAMFVPFLEPSLNTFFAVLIFLMAFSIVAKNYVILAIILYTGVTVLSHTYLYPDQTVLRHLALGTALSALTLLHVTLLMGPLAKFNTTFAKLLKHRRNVGVSVFLLALFHAMLIIGKYYDFKPEYIYSLTSNYYGSISLIILSMLAATSFNYFQYKMPLKYYNVIHTGGLIFYVLYTTFLLQMGFLEFGIYNYALTIVFVAFWLLTAPWTLPRTLFLKVNAWKQLHYLVYLAYIAVIVHAWTGYFAFEKLPMQIVFWGMFLLVIIVHTAGWIKKLINKRKLQLNINEVQNDNQ